MKKVTALALASVMALGACSAFLAACKPKDEPPPVDETAQEEFEAYRTQLAVYARGYNGAGKSDEQIANEGLAALEGWMKELGLAMNISELGATPDMIEGIADATLIMQGGYKVLDRGEIVKILRESL